MWFVVRRPRKCVLRLRASAKLKHDEAWRRRPALCTRLPTAYIQVIHPFRSRTTGEGSDVCHYDRIVTRQNYPSSSVVLRLAAVSWEALVRYSLHTPFPLCKVCSQLIFTAITSRGAEDRQLEGHQGGSRRASNRPFASVVERARGARSDSQLDSPPKHPQKQLYTSAPSHVPGLHCRSPVQPALPTQRLCVTAPTRLGCLPQSYTYRVGISTVALNAAPSLLVFPSVHASPSTGRLKTSL